jgi:uncharacterized cysteine cluster protein YcgN (CxxCxxCC family)
MFVVPHTRDRSLVEMAEASRLSLCRGYSCGMRCIVEALGQKLAGVYDCQVY